MYGLGQLIDLLADRFSLSVYSIVADNWGGLLSMTHLIHLSPIFAELLRVLENYNSHLSFFNSILWAFKNKL